MEELYMFPPDVPPLKCSHFGVYKTGDVVEVVKALGYEVRTLTEADLLK